MISAAYAAKASFLDLNKMTWSSEGADCNSVTQQQIVPSKMNWPCKVPVDLNTGWTHWIIFLGLDAEALVSKSSPSDSLAACLDERRGLACDRPPKAKQVCKREVVPSCFATCTLAQCPTTASNVQFDLLCCQPRPVPETLSTRTCPFTVSCPCGLPAWHGRAINMHDTDMHNLLHLPSFLQ